MSSTQERVIKMVAEQLGVKEEDVKPLADSQLPVVSAAAGLCRAAVFNISLPSSIPLTGKLPADRAFAMCRVAYRVLT